MCSQHVNRWIYDLSLAAFWWLPGKPAVLELLRLPSGTQQGQTDFHRMSVRENRYVSIPVSVCVSTAWVLRRWSFPALAMRSQKYAERQLSSKRVALCTLFSTARGLFWDCIVVGGGELFPPLSFQKWIFWLTAVKLQKSFRRRLNSSSGLQIFIRGTKTSPSVCGSVWTNFCPASFGQCLGNHGTSAVLPVQQWPARLTHPGGNQRWPSGQWAATRCFSSDHSASWLAEWNSIITSPPYLSLSHTRAHLTLRHRWRAHADRQPYSLLLPIKIRRMKTETELPTVALGEFG